MKKTITVLLCAAALAGCTPPATPRATPETMHLDEWYQLHRSLPHESPTSSPTPSAE